MFESYRGYDQIGKKNILKFFFFVGSGSRILVHF